ncbi:hypothetical protein BGW38_010403 [Lunasporangiospora selenospora]|uniref:CCHC-type domain-containing protein n=1 Tax=Lunasporangiospora selenospora TaxID=979761 RepID=A0A9P6FWA1_9FUNG|nr:hypothetical protein BGW38_010403 [Lunasporangiospora selenospora]
MSDSDLNLQSIVSMLQSKPLTSSKDVADSRPQRTTQSEATVIQHPHLVPSSLKVETALLTKELAKFRPCDQNNCFYCREWAQWVFKKTFGKEKQGPGSVINASDKKGRPSGSSNSSGHINTGEHKNKHKEYAMVVCERFYQRSTAAEGASGNGSARSSPSSSHGGAGSVAAAAIAASKTKTGTGSAAASGGSASSTKTGQEGFVSEIVDTVREWIQQPSALYTSPEVFSLVDFEALYASLPLAAIEQQQQSSSLQQQQQAQQDDVTPILAAITIDKAQMVLAHQGYPLLKRVTKAQLQNQIMSPTCNHKKGMSKTPADLELDKELFNEELKKMRTRDQEGLRKQIGPVWKHVEEALERMDGAEKVRSDILSPSRTKEFAQTYKDKLVTFQEIWNDVEAAAKKTSTRKKGLSADNAALDPVEEVDQGFRVFIDNMQFIHKQLISDVLESSERSLREFIKELAAAQAKILKMALTRIQEGKVGTARIDKILEESPEKCRNALKMVEQLIPIFDTKMAQFRVLILNKFKEVDEEVEAVAATFWQESQKTVQGRLEKVANKEFRRRIKKLEFLSVETRKWFFQSRLTLFSSLDFATVCLNTLGILMEEAEVLEAVQLGLHDDHFQSRVLKSQEGRKKLSQHFREGIKTGRRVLAVMISRMMMREGARAMGEMAAIQKGKKFLKSIGQDVNDDRLNGKGLLVPSREATPTASANVSDNEDADDATNGATTISKSKKKKEKKKKKAAEAAAAAAAAGTTIDVEAQVESGQPQGPEASQTTSGRATNLSVIDGAASTMSSKEARELKKMAKKEAKKQAKEDADAEELAKEAEAARKAETARRAKEFKEAQEAIERQEAQEMRDREAARVAQEKRAAQEALELEQARVRKAAEEAEARRKAQEAREVKEALDRERAKEAKENREAIKAEKKSAPTYASASATRTNNKASGNKAASNKAASNKVSSSSTSKKEVTPDHTLPPVAVEPKIPTWGPSAVTPTNRVESVVEEAGPQESEVADAKPSSALPPSDGWSDAPTKKEGERGVASPQRDEGWGAAPTKKDEGWEAAPTKTEEGWGAAPTKKEDEWGTESLKKEEGWGAAPTKADNGWETVPSTKEDGWGAAPSTKEEGQGTVPAKTEDGWGSAPTKAEDGWGSSPTKKEERWGAAPSVAEKDPWEVAMASAMDEWGSAPAPAKDNGNAKRTSGVDAWTSKPTEASNAWGPKPTASPDARGKKPAPTSDNRGSKPTPPSRGWGSKSATPAPASDNWGSKPASVVDSWDVKPAPAPDAWGPKSRSPSSNWDTKPAPTSDAWGPKSRSTSNNWDAKSTPVSDGWGAKSAATSNDTSAQPTTSQEPWDAHPSILATAQALPSPAAPSSVEGGWSSALPSVSNQWPSAPSQATSSIRTPESGDLASVGQYPSISREETAESKKPVVAMAGPLQEHALEGSGAEELARLPKETLVSLVNTLQVENKSLLTTLVSMQQQVSSLTERYSTLASLARQHEQQAIQAMEAQKQREMEEVQRYVWKLEERCRQLEKHVLNTHRMQMQQMQQFQQQHQQQQQQQQQHTGPPGMPPPGFGNMLGLGRQASAPSSPSMAQRSLNINGMDHVPMSPSNISSSAAMAMMYSNMMSSANGGGFDPAHSPLTANSSASILSSVPSNMSSPPSGSTGLMSATAASGPANEIAGPKKSHWRHRGEVRCGNCAQQGHSSAECREGCRYCGQAGHLSQDCHRMSSQHL